MTWTQLDELDKSITIPILPIGAIEAHGPHLPLSTDGIIAKAMAEQTARVLENHGLTAILLPPFDFTCADFARSFPGTLSFRTSTVKAMLADIVRGLSSQGWPLLAVANSHLDPTHVHCLREAFQGCPLKIAFPDLTRRRWASSLSEEFQSGACHAGQYEGSIVLAHRPELVREDVAAALPDNPSSLVTAIRDGKDNFRDAGGPQAYFGSPRLATAEEGMATTTVLGHMLVTAILEERART